MRRLPALVVAIVTAPAALFAQPFPERDVPPELRPWVAWVRDEVPDRVCPVVGGASVCLWPGRLALRLGASGGEFSLSAEADRSLDIRLPGDAQHWPQDVRLDGKPAVVVGREGGPATRLPEGTHRIEGRFVWTRLPDSLSVPARLALVDLSVEGRVVEMPRRDEAGLVWLHSDSEAMG